ncbi:bifunctional nuclease family protein [Kiritimatiellota bacterium B12222]|nr:bifunctional nuclease family protein [Kiritimatiellota bacterium B12222]
MMDNNLIHVTIAGLLPSPGGSGVFLHSGDKAMTIFIDPMVTRALQWALDGVEAPRPLTHDLTHSILDGLGVTLLHVVIHDMQGETFFARLHLQQKNELGQSFLEIDSRPSDAMVLAVQWGAPIYVKKDVWEKVENMKWAMDQLSVREGDA